MNRKEVKKIENISKNYDKYLILVIGILIFIILALVIYGMVVY